LAPEQTSHEVSQHHTPRGLLEVGLFFTLTLLILRIVLYPLFSLVGVE
jgi:hypothetical protein